MTYDYRILYTEINGEEEYCIHEVYYDEDMNICLISEDQTYLPGGSTLVEMRTELYNMLYAFGKPILNKKSLLESFSKGEKFVEKKKTTCI